MRRLAIACLLVVGCRGRATSLGAASACDASLASLHLSDARVVSAERMAESGRPAYCRVRGVATPTPGSLINFEVWVPDAAVWNGKLVATGNGGYSPALNTGDMTYALRQGYAVVGGDTGHQTADPNDLTFVVGHPERMVDWGTRSIHAIAGPAKQIVAMVRGRAPSRAYYYGCSTGGHQGFAELQRYPDDFDGVIAGAPGNDRVRLNVGFLWQYLSSHERGGDSTTVIPVTKLPTITAAVVRACDARDGVTDGVVDDPRVCAFDPGSLECRGADAPDCLTASQLAALRRMYAGARNPRTGEQLYPGWPPGSETGWPAYWGRTEPARVDFWRYWVFQDSTWSPRSFDFDRDVARADSTAGRAIDQTSADIDAFARRGGKAIVYHGWQDPVASAYNTVAYYERVRARLGSQEKTDRFFRLFMVPGMGHCAGGTGATSFGNMGAPAPVIDADHDLLSALDRWVERGDAPERIVASRVTNGTVTRTRPLCPYPKRATYTGRGSTDDASNFVCR
jgi:feruloyl esterase